jgi:ribonuclease G
MANPKNRATVEEALKTELERDRTKTYVVEISPLGLVEMTRQNVTDGPREILTRKCTICGGDGIVLSESSAAVDAERHLRELVSGAPRTKAFKVALNAKVASLVIGPGASRLVEIEEETRRRFLIEAREDVSADHFEVLGKGTLESLRPETPVQEGKQVELKLVEVDLYDVNAGAGKLDGLSVCVSGGASLIGKKAKVRIERVLNGTAYATLVGGPKQPATPITAESEAEKPTRKPPARKGKPKAEEPEPEEAVAVEEAEGEPEAEAVAEADKPKKKTRRGSRGGRRRRKKPAAAAGAAPADGEGPKIHLPGPELGRAEEPEPVAEAAPSEDGTEPPKPKKKTRRGSRGGRRRRKSGSQAASAPTE